MFVCLCLFLSCFLWSFFKVIFIYFVFDAKRTHTQKLVLSCYFFFCFTITIFLLEKCNHLTVVSLFCNSSKENESDSSENDKIKQLGVNHMMFFFSHRLRFEILFIFFSPL